MMFVNACLKISTWTKLENKVSAEPQETNPDIRQGKAVQENAVCILIPPQSLRFGMICPRCHAAKIDYDGMLNLVCPNCRLTEAGSCT